MSDEATQQWLRDEGLYPVDDCLECQRILVGYWHARCAHAEHKFLREFHTNEGRLEEAELHRGKAWTWKTGFWEKNKELRSHVRESHLS